MRVKWHNKQEHRADSPTLRPRESVANMVSTRQPLLPHLWRRQDSRTNQAGNKAARSLSEQCLPLPLPLPPAVQRVTAQTGHTHHTFFFLKHYFRKLELSLGDWDTHPLKVIKMQVWVPAGTPWWPNHGKMVGWEGEKYKNLRQVD